MKLGKRIAQSLGAAALSLTILTSTLVAAPSAYADTAITVGNKAVVTNTDGDTIRVREDAGTEFDQIAEAAEGQTVSVLAGPKRDKKGNRWFKVQTPNGTGWIVAGFLEGKDAPAVAETKPATKPVEKTVVEKKSTAPKITGFARVANTDGDPLRVRSVPGTEGKILTTFAPDTTVAIKAGPVTDESSVSWYQITASGTTGWAMAQYLVQAKAPSEPAAEKPAAPKSKPVVEAKEAVAETQTKPVVEAKPVVIEKAKSEPAKVEPVAETPRINLGLGESVVNLAMKYVGYRYVRGGTTPRGFDCSGYTYYVYNQMGYKLSRDMKVQINSGARISTANLQPGDLLFWQNTYKRGLSHVGIYIGNGKFVHAANESVGVTVSSMYTSYWASRYVGATRPR